MTLGIASDYAVLRAAGFEFYFGYEVTTGSSQDLEDAELEDAEWCFEAKFPDGSKIIIPQSELQSDDVSTGDSPTLWLLAGIALLFGRGLVAAA